MCDRNADYKDGRRVLWRYNPRLDIHSVREDGWDKAGEAEFDGEIPLLVAEHKLKVAALGKPPWWVADTLATR